MEFLVYRTAGWDLEDDEPPVEGAVARPCVDARGWRDDAWTIEVGSFRDLEAIAKRADVERVVIHFDERDGKPAIELYDGYRE